ncbi:MAG: PEFG-CTERM sorting domain-containing protein [Nitrosarchaeum sp.]|nr:PEFG-CTERM sorting domain-containing protein [Nitrosarchaeum sp.]
MNYLFFLLPFLIFNATVFAQTQTYPDSSEYILTVDQHTYSIHYVVNSNIIAMDIDPESKSLLIGLENTHDSQFIIDLEHELIDAQNNEFVILVDSQEVDYKITSNSNSSTFEFFVPIGSEEVEIIGTHVIPEFPFSVIFGLVIMISSIIIFTKVKTPFFKL